jgi:hypothetical protein
MGLDKAKITALYEKKTKPEGNLYTKRQTLDSLHVDHKAQAILNSHIYFLKKHANGYRPIICQLDTRSSQ